jgi:uncharacterized phage protein (TIGR01671 family)
MNRIIKFRAWTGEEMVFVHTLDIYPDSDACRVNTSVNSHYEKWPLMQFSGLHDKNGKPIYESDIIKWKFVNTGEEEPEYTEIVEWSECGFFLDGGAPLTVAMDDCEIIGNIFESPDLIPHK